MELRDGRLLLREFEATDVSPFTTIHSDPRILQYYAPGSWTPEHARMLVESFMNWASNKPRQNYQFAIVHVETNQLLGSCGVRKKGYPEGQAEFGVGIDADWWGRGVAQEAARMTLGFGFRELSLEEIHAETVSANFAAAKLVERLGFSPGGPRPAPSWMAERGWAAVNWVLTREVWKQDHGVGISG